MRILLLLTTLILIIFSGCTSSETPNKNVNINSANTNTTKPNANSPIATETKPREETVNQADTIAPVVKAYCDAIRKKDEASLRKIYSQASLKSLEKDMKAENINSLIEYLSSEPVGDKPCQVRNEKIQGDRAIAEVTTETYPNGVPMYFVKESGEWKITNESPALQNVDKGASKSK